MHPQSATILFNNVALQYSSKVTHLGHILTSTLDDSEDIARVLFKDLIRKDDSVLCTLDPFVKTSIWSLGAKQIRQLEIGFTNFAEDIWHVKASSKPEA